MGLARHVCDRTGNKILVYGLLSRKYDYLKKIYYLKTNSIGLIIFMQDLEWKREAS